MNETRLPFDCVAIAATTMMEKGAKIHGAISALSQNVTSETKTKLVSVNGELMVGGVR